MSNVMWYDVTFMITVSVIVLVLEKMGQFIQAHCSPCNTHTQSILETSSWYKWLMPGTIHHTRTARSMHDDVIKWKHFPRYWPFVRGIHRLVKDATCLIWLTANSEEQVPMRKCGKKASNAELWFFFELPLTGRLSKQWWGWWFETPSCPLWRHRNGLKHTCRPSRVESIHLTW